MRLGYVPILTVLMIFTSCSILRKLSNNYTENILNINIEMVEVKGGNFKMGCDEQRRECEDEDLPVHSVHLNDFYIGKYEITFEQYDLFCESTGREKPNDNNWGRKNRPVINVNWLDATAFCEWLSKESGKKYRLPTEAEWEYAARGGNQAPFFFEGNPRDFSREGFFSKLFRKENNIIDQYVIYAGNSQGRTELPDAVQPNPYGLKNMLGNVMEYCSDWYAEDAYSLLQDGAIDPKGPVAGEEDAADIAGAAGVVERRVEVGLRRMGDAPDDLPRRRIDDLDALALGAATPFATNEKLRIGKTGLGHVVRALIVVWEWRLLLLSKPQEWRFYPFLSSLSLSSWRRNSSTCSRRLSS